MNRSNGLASPNSSCLTCRLDVAAERFGDTPGLRNAPALLIRWLGVENFADRANGAFIQLLVEPFHKASGARPVVQGRLEQKLTQDLERLREVLA